MRVTEDFLTELEVSIRDNKAPTVANLVRNIRTQEIPRHLLARYANLVRRLGGTKYAVRILSPVILNPRAKPNIQEKVEYASCLTRLGLAPLSIAILSSVKSNDDSEAIYELAAAYVQQWDYESAIPLFEKYVRFPELPKYRKCIGEINLAASYVYVGRSKDAKNLLERLLVKTKAEGFKLLTGNSYELLCEISIVSGNFERAIEYIGLAQEFLSNRVSRYELFARKWNLVIKMLRARDPKPFEAEFLELRQSAARFGEWSALIELEVYRAIAASNGARIEQIYYGVPQPGLRKHISSIWKSPIRNLSQFELRLGKIGSDPSPILDVARGYDHRSRGKLKFGQGLHRLLQALASDRFRPFSTTRLFPHLFQNQSYNPITSPQQVYGMVKRLNAWFEEFSIPLIVVASRFGYRLRANAPYTLLIKTSEAVETKTDEFIKRLGEAGLTQLFTIADVKSHLKIPRRSATRLLSEAVAAGKLTRVGRTRTLKYSIS